MRNLNLATLLFALSGSLLPGALSAQQTDQKQDEIQTQSQNVPVQPERTPQQSDKARQQDDRATEERKIDRDWTARRPGNDDMDMDRSRQRRMGRMDEDRDGRTVGRNWRLDNDDLDRGSRDADRHSRYGSMGRDEGRYYDSRPRRRVKTCIEYDNGDEYCRYRD